jgi:hypothetical protein
LFLRSCIISGLCERIARRQEQRCRPFGILGSEIVCLDKEPCSGPVRATLAGFCRSANLAIDFINRYVSSDGSGCGSM